MINQEALRDEKRRQFLQSFLPDLAPVRLPAYGRSQSATTPPLGLIAINRMAFGPRPGHFDLNTFNAFGANDIDRLNNFIEWQLAPETIADSEFDARLAEAAFITLNKSRTQLWTEHYRGDGDWNFRTLALREIERLLFIRAIYSQRQLAEMLADFWHNHFNILGWSLSQISSMFVYFDRDVIRANMLGNFRDMLDLVAKSTEMLYYLDNYTNSNAGPNENWARELFELHTLGAENYLGVMRQSDVPLDGDGRPIGYVDDDVYEATRCFTGWTVANSSSGPGGDTGEFLYRSDWHDRFQKFVLGSFIPPDQAELVDGHDVLDLVAYHPGTARHICRKLCRRLIADDPPEALVLSAADIFFAQQTAPDQLKQVVRHILQSTEFQTTWTEKVKRPFEVIVSALRATNADYTIKMDDDDSNSFMWRYDQLGQAPFSWPPPNGYPDTRADWQSTTPMLFRWRLINYLVDKRDDNDNYRLDILGQTPGTARSANELVDFWADRVYDYAIPDGERQIIVDFMAQEEDPDTDLDFTSSSVESRLRSMVALLLNAPQFQHR